MKHAALATVLLLTPTMGWAAPPPDVKLTLSVQQAGDLLDGILSLNGGYDRIIKDGKDERVVKQPYQLSGLTRLAFARDIARLRPVVAAFQEAHNSKLAELSGGKPSVAAGSDAAAALSAEDAKMLAVKQDIELTPLTQDELKLDVNPIAAGTLSALLPILLDPNATAQK